MDERYTRSSETMLRATNSDDEIGLDISLLLEWKATDFEDETRLTVTYTVSMDEDEVILISGRPKNESYQGLLHAAEDPKIKGFDLIIEAPAFPRHNKKAIVSVETVIHIELSGPMGFRDFLRTVTNEVPPDSDEEHGGSAFISVEHGPKSKNRIH